MSVLVGKYPRRREGETVCARCGDPTREPFERRGPCECGSNAWTTGKHMTWPPMVPTPAPAFLYDLSIPAMVELPVAACARSVASRGERNGGAKLNPENVAAIRRMSIAGRSIRKLAKQYHVSRRTIEQLLVGHSWRQE